MSISSSTKPLLVTGAAGQLGRRVIELLLAQRTADSPPIIATTRNPAAIADLAARGVVVRQADFDAEEGLAAAFAGAGRALLISTDAVDRPGRRVVQHRAAIRALSAAEVEHVVYTSLPNPTADSPVLIAEDHRLTEEALAASSLDFTILRNNLYTDLLLGSLPGAIAGGQLIDARGDYGVAFVTREDCARAAAAALSGNSTGRRTLTVTGPESLTGEEVAAITTELFGRKVTRVQLTAQALDQALREHGLPAPVAALFVSFDLGIARGDLAPVADTVQALTGRAPQSVRDFLSEHRAALAPQE